VPHAALLGAGDDDERARLLLHRQRLRWEDEDRARELARQERLMLARTDGERNLIMLGVIR
jgi:hypothetical protein